MTATLFATEVRGFRDSFSAIDRAQNITSVVFIDAAVEDYQSLIAGVVEGVEAIVLDLQRDGVEQISEVLSDRTNIDAVHIVSHGSPGSIRLGNTALSTLTLQAYAPLLKKWRESLAPGAAILLYGCRVGADIMFLQNLRELTGANIAASKNLTGNAVLGGDWNLEVTAGAIDRPLAFKRGVMQAYSHVFAEIPVTTLLDEDNGNRLPNVGAGTSLREAIMYSAAGDTIKLDDKIYTLTILGKNEDLGKTGDLDIRHNLTIEGKGEKTIVQTNLKRGKVWDDRVFDIHSDNNLTISNLKILGGNVADEGGGIRNSGGTLNISEVTIADNTAKQDGGGIYNKDGKVKIEKSTIFNNSTLEKRGGGIFNSEGAVDFSYSTIDNNKALLSGGGIHNDAATATLMISNSTISANKVTGNKANNDGGGIYNNDGKATLTNVTIAKNAANNGGGVVNIAGIVEVQNTIVASNSSGVNNVKAAPDVQGMFKDLGNNLIGINNGSDFVFVAGGLIGKAGAPVNPKLGPLQDNGGNSRTKTHELLAGSRAIDAGNNAAAPGKVDQRGQGFLRIVNDKVDIGAFEVQKAPPPKKVGFAAPAYSTTEATVATAVTVPVILSETPDEDVTVFIFTNASSTATLDADYTFTPASLTFPAGTTELSQNITVTINPDDIPELDETAFFEFSDIINAEPGDITQTAVTILANDIPTPTPTPTPTPISTPTPAPTPTPTPISTPTPAFSFSTTNYTIAEGSTASIEVFRGNTNVAVSFNTADGSAVAGGSQSDYIAASGTLNFAIGQTSATFTVSTIDDTSIELSETVNLFLSNGSTDSLTSAVLTITDNDTLVGNTRDTLVAIDGDTIGVDRTDVLSTVNPAINTLNGARNNDSISASQISDSLGSTANDLLFGNQDLDSIGGDILMGSATSNLLNGFDGNDTLYGGKDRDTLIGAGGDDVLYGDLGNDCLIGGSGNDIFVLNIGGGSDIVTDWQDGQDLLGLTGGLTFGQLSVTQHNSGALISYGDRLLATVIGVSANQITAGDFKLI